MDDKERKMKFKANNRELEIKFNVHMNKNVDEKATQILKDLFENRNPINKIQRLKYILRNKKRIMGGTVSVPKLYNKEAVVYIDYPGMFKDNDKHNYRLKDLKNFDEEELTDTAIHETAHAYHCLNSKIAFKRLKELLKYDKIKPKGDFYLKLNKELKRFPLMIYFEGYAQIVDYFGKYYFFTKKDFRKQYGKMMTSANELKRVFDDAIKTRNKSIFERLNYNPYHLGTRIYYSILYFDKKESFETLIKYDIKELFTKFERIMQKNHLKIPLSYESRKGIFDIKGAIKESKKGLD